MYTFIAICAGLFLLSGIIFKKKIQEYQFFVYVIIIFGSLIGSTIVNGVLGLDVPYSKVLHKEKIIEDTYANLWIVNDTIANDSMVFDSVLNTMVPFDSINSDTILKAYAPLKYYYEKDSSGNITKNYLRIGEVDQYFNDSLSIDGLTIRLSEDTIPRVKIYKYRRVIDSKWVASFGLPSRGDRSYEVTIPDTDENRILVDILNENYYGKTKI